jgi:6-phosphogluconolactonase
MMRLRSLAGLFALLCLSLTLAGCGGSSSSGGGTNPPPPPKEFLFGAGNISAFSVNTQTGTLTKTSSIAGDRVGFGIATNPSVTFLYADDMANGGIDGFSISPSGVLSEIAGSPFAMPSGWSETFVDRIVVDPSGRFLYVPDAAANAVVGFTINATTGALTPMSSPFPAGAWPQQAVSTPAGKFLYVSNVNDPNSSVSGYTIDSSTGALASIAGSPFAAATGSGGSDGLVVDSSGKFLYVALPSNNSIAAFTIDSNTGRLTMVPGSPFSPNLAGAYPFIFSIALHPSGKFLYAQGDQNAEIYGFTVDSGSGGLTPMTDSPFSTGALTYMNDIVVEPSGNFLYIGNTNGSLSYMSIDQTTGALSPILPGAFIGYCPGLTVAKMP